MSMKQAKWRDRSTRSIIAAGGSVRNGGEERYVNFSGGAPGGGTLPGGGTPPGAGTLPGASNPSATASCVTISMLSVDASARVDFLGEALALVMYCLNSRMAVAGGREGGKSLRFVHGCAWRGGERQRRAHCEFERMVTISIGASAVRLWSQRRGVGGPIDCGSDVCVAVRSQRACPLS